MNARYLLAFLCLAVGAASLFGGTLAARGAGVSVGECTTIPVQMGDGSVRNMLAPPTPEVRVRAISARVVRFDWRFRARPSKCAPAGLFLSVRPGDRKFTPWTENVRVSASSGTHTIRLPGFYVRSHTALASAYTREGLRTPVVQITIRD